MSYMQTPTWDKAQPIVPFDNQGNMVNHGWVAAIWTRVYNFRSAMKIIGWSPTNSSTIITLQSEDGINYPIYISDFIAVLKHKKIVDGTVESSVWTFRKVGQSYAIMLAS